MFSIVVFTLYVYLLIARRTAWPTLNTRMIRSTKCVLDDPKLVLDRESARKAVLFAAPSFVGLTSSVGNNNDTLALHLLAS
jgi:hypothetical protein